MKQEQQQKEFLRRIMIVIDGFSREYTLTYASMIGCLQIAISELLIRRKHNSNEKRN